MQELWFLHSACRLMLIDIYMKFLGDSSEWTQVWQTNRQTPGKKQYASQP